LARPRSVISLTRLGVQLKRNTQSSHTQTSNHMHRPEKAVGRLFDGEHKNKKRKKEKRKKKKTPK